MLQETTKKREGGERMKIKHQIF